MSFLSVNKEDETKSIGEIFHWLLLGAETERNIKMRRMIQFER